MLLIVNKVVMLIVIVFIEKLYSVCLVKSPFGYLYNHNPL